MTSNPFRSIPIIDGHIHFGHPSYRENLVQILDQANIGRFNIVCTPHMQRLSLVPDALQLKALFPRRCYVFGGLDISTLFMAPQYAGEVFAHYVDSLLEMGCDGIKMIEGKPQMRKTLPIPDFDAAVYAPYWDHMAETGTPLVFHVNDPEEFWDAERCPGWAKKMGWFYGDGTYINNEVQYRQVLNVLERHPNLNVIFAHFFFLSAQLERLSGYLDRFPNMQVDLTPGIEMYMNFARDPQKAREFFIKYQDRIVYGTDIGAKALLATPGMNVTPLKAACASSSSVAFWRRKDPSSCNRRKASSLVTPNSPSRASPCRMKCWKRSTTAILNAACSPSPERSTSPRSLKNAIARKRYWVPCALCSPTRVLTWD